MPRLSDIAATGAVTLATTGGTAGLRKDFIGLELSLTGRGTKGRATLAKDGPTVGTNRNRTVATDARQAVTAFLAAMAEELGEGALPFKLWARNYEQMAPLEGWPPVSEKVLSLAMQAAGCRRREIDGRKRGRGRYIAFELPRRAE